MKEPLHDLIKLIGGKAVPSHPILMLVALAVMVLILVNAYKVHRFVVDDPQYCALCHQIEDAHREWRVSAHRHQVCQQCHSMGIISQNKLFLSYLLTWDQSKISHEHGREAPWGHCHRCHLETTTAAGAQDKELRKSSGHARHVFMENISCRQCHSGRTHNFYTEIRLCLECHRQEELEELDQGKVFTDILSF